MESMHIPATWSELRAEVAGRPGSSANAFMWFYNNLQSRPEDDVTVGPDLYGAAEALIRGALLERRDVVAALLPHVAPRARTIAGAPSHDFDEHNLANLGALALLAFEESGGWHSDPGSAGPALSSLLAHELRTEAHAQRTVWACLAYGRAEGLGPLLPVDPGEKPPDPDADFEGNDELIRLHFARCILHGAGAEAARRAWEAWIETFPFMLGARDASWPELLWSARAMHVALGGQPPGTTLDWLTEQLP